MDDPIHPVPKLSVYEKSLLTDNKRLRDELAILASMLDPAWKEIGYPLKSDWMVKEIIKLNKHIETLLALVNKNDRNP